MSKRFYTDYTNHMLRYYVRNAEFIGITEIDAENWGTCHCVYKQLSEEDKLIVFKVFNDRSILLSGAVSTVSDELELKQSHIWQRINEISKMIATQRRLI